MNIAQTVTVTVFTKLINFAVTDRLRLVSRNREITAVGDNFRFLLFWKNTNKATLFNPDRKEKVYRAYRKLYRFWHTMSSCPQCCVRLLHCLINGFVNVPENLIFMFSQRFAVRLVDFIFSVSIGQKSGFFFLPDIAM